MARPGKSLADHVRDQTFRARRENHAELLDDSPPLPFPGLAALQGEYAAADHPLLQRNVALRFEKAMRDLGQSGALGAYGDVKEALLKLGPAGSYKRLSGMYPKYFRHFQGPCAGQRFDLHAFQRKVLRKFLERDRRGRRKYIWLLLGMPRGNGKTPILAGLGYDGLFSRSDHPFIQTVAGSKLQARLGMDFASEWRERSPELGDWTRAGAWHIECPGTGGRWQIMSSDGRLGHGPNPSRGLCDEWHVIESVREEQAVIAILSALHKRDGDFAAGTTAGYDKTTQLGEQFEEMLRAPSVDVTLNGCLTIAEDSAARKLMIWYGIPEDYELDRDSVLAGEHDKVLRACNPLPSLSLEAIRGEFALLPFDEACRLIGNRWTKAKDVWISSGMWNRLRSDTHIPDGARIWVGVDAAKKRDTTAVVWAAWVDGRIVLRSRVWSCNPAKPAHVMIPGERIYNKLVREFIWHELAQRYQIEEVVFDPRFFDDQAEELDELGLTVAEFVQSSPAMRDAWTHWDEAIGESSFSWGDDDRQYGIFSQHVTAASAVWTESGWKVFKTKHDDRKAIDALVAAAMARERCARAGAVGDADFEWADPDELFLDDDGDDA